VIKIIIELLFAPIFSLLKFIISFLPSGFSLPSWLSDSISVVSRGLIFFPVDVWKVLIGNILFWLYAQLVWAIIEWIYRKIPGIS